MQSGGNQSRRCTSFVTHAFSEGPSVQVTSHVHAHCTEEVVLLNAPVSFEGAVLAGVLGQAEQELDVMFVSEVRWADPARVSHLGSKKGRQSAGSTPRRHIISAVNYVTTGTAREQNMRRRTKAADVHRCRRCRPQQPSVPPLPIATG